MKCGVVPSSWHGITNVLSAKPNLDLLEEVDKRGVDHKDLEAVRAVWNEMQEQAHTKLKEVSKRIDERRVDAQKDAKVVEEIEDTFPAVKRKRKSAGGRLG